MRRETHVVTFMQTRSGSNEKLIVWTARIIAALQTGLVDGAENILSSYTSQKYLEVQKFVTLT